MTAQPSSRPPYLQACPDPVPGTVTLTDLEDLDAWVLRVAQGEVTPRDVAQRVRDIVTEMRRVLTRDMGKTVALLGDDWLTVKEAARLLGITPAGVYDRIYNRHIPQTIVRRAGRSGQTWQINHQGLITWLSAREGSK